MMLVAQKIDKIKFSKDNYKDSYLRAVKFASMLISSERKLCFRYEKDLEDKKSIYLIIMFLYDESELSSHRCKVCQEFHHSFFINDETNCNICKMRAYRKELEKESKQIARIIKEELNANDK